MRADDFFRELEAERPEYREAWAVQEPSLTLALNISRLRRERGMSQKQLATAAGMKQPKIAQIERGDANPELRTIGRLAHALNVSASSLLRDPHDDSATSLTEVHRASAASVDALGFAEILIGGARAVAHYRNGGGYVSSSTANDNFTLAG